MLILRGPVKVDLLFLEESQEQAGPWVPSTDTLEAIDRHFWDCILWLEQKRRHGLDDVVGPGLERMHELMLGPLGVTQAPASVAEALASYLAARDELERRFGVRVSRELEREVRPALARCDARQPWPRSSVRGPGSENPSLR